jgi:hypothetical protein
LEVAAIGRDKKQDYFLADKFGNCIKIAADTPDFWTLIAYAFRVPFRVFGIWNGKNFFPFSVIRRDEILLLQ